MKILSYTAQPLTELAAEAVAQLQRDELVCVPTDTVYGILCAADSTLALDRMRRAKGRDADKPFALFVSPQDLRNPIFQLNPPAERLTQAFFPGALTLVIQAREDCPCRQNRAVGVRSPDHPLIQELLAQFPGFLANTSLNRSGQAPFLSLDGAEELLSSMALTIDAGPLPPSEPSTVVDCTTETPGILREGALPKEKILTLLQSLKD